MSQDTFSLRTDMSHQATCLGADREIAVVEGILLGPSLGSKLDPGRNARDVVVGPWSFAA